MGSGLTHAPSAAAGAESPAFTTERHQVFEVAGLTLGPQESMGQDPTSQILIKLFDHEIRQAVPSLLFNLFLKREPVVLDDFVEGCFLGLVPGIGVGFCC